MNYNVSFPSLGMEFTVSPTAFTIGSVTIQWYGIIIAVGVILAILYALRSCKKFNIDQDKLIDCILVGLIGGIIGARLYYVIFYPGSDYIEDPMKIFAIRDGGLGIYGGVIGGLLCGSLMAKFRKLKVFAVLDIASLGFLIGQCIGRWGNYVNQEAFGRETDLPWGMLSERTQAVANGPVHPCFLYESLWCLLGFILLHIFSRKLRRYDGQVFLLYLVWYGIGRFFVEGLRTDSLITPFLDLRVSQVVAVATVLVAIVLLIVFYKKTALTGCGSKKVMELNHIVLETKKKKDELISIDNGTPSTIFGDLENDIDDSDALADTEKNEEQEQKQNIIDTEMTEDLKINQEEDMTELSDKAIETPEDSSKEN